MYIKTLFAAALAVGLLASSAANAAPLVKKNDSVDIGIPETTHMRAAAAAGPAVQKNHRLAVRISALFIIKPVVTADFEKAGVIWLNRRIKLAPCALRCHGGIMKGTGPECYSY